MVGKKLYINDEIVKLVKALEKTILIESIILFGSHAKGNASEESDIDIAVVSTEFGENPFRDKQLVYRTIIKEDIEPAFEVHTFSASEMKNSDNFFVSEIRSTGIKIWPQEEISSFRKPPSGAPV